MLDTEESRDALSELHGPNVIYCWDMTILLYNETEGL